MSYSDVRPRTTNPRGICKYHTNPRGCPHGSSCKFLHGVAEQLDPQDRLLTPYDESKRCRFYAQGQYCAAHCLNSSPHFLLLVGFCRHGDQCWFKHIPEDPGPSQRRELLGEDDSQNEPCSICFEKPVTYGLLCTFPFLLHSLLPWLHPI
jgi:E3 ubiquitin-protein ligase makorin